MLIVTRCAIAPPKKFGRHEVARAKGSPSVPQVFHDEKMRIIRGGVRQAEHIYKHAKCKRENYDPISAAIFQIFWPTIRWPCPKFFEALLAGDREKLAHMLTEVCAAPSVVGMAGVLIAAIDSASMGPPVSTSGSTQSAAAASGGAIGPSGRGFVPVHKPMRA
jgi:hypothetical protein